MPDKTTIFSYGKQTISGNVFFSISAVLCFSICTIGYFWISGEYRRFQNETDKFKNNYTESRKNLLRSEIARLERYINKQEENVNGQIRTNLKNRIDEAYAIVNSIYSNYKDKLSEEELKKLIVDALRAVRFNSGRDYFFISDMKNRRHILHPLNPEIEGKSLSNVETLLGTSLIDECDRCPLDPQKDMFIDYRWYKPGCGECLYTKVGIVKRFTPYNWIIGTGEYMDDAEEEIKREVLRYIDSLQFGDNGYIATLDKTGIMLSHPNPVYRNKQMMHIQDPNGVRVVEESFNIGRNPEGGFLSYTWGKPPDFKPAPKLSFVKVNEKWNWLFIAGVYTDEIDKITAERQQELYGDVLRNLIQILAILISLTALSFLFTIYISGKLKSEFNNIFKFLKKSSTDPAHQMNPEDFHYAEFVELAKYANENAKIRLTAEQDKEKLIKELTEALDNIKTLKGMLPICASCGKVREGDGHWEQLETYVKAHSEADFSHGLCPDCVKKLYPEYSGE